MWGEGDGSKEAQFWKAINNFPPTIPPSPSEGQIGNGFTVLQHKGYRNEGGERKAGGCNGTIVSHVVEFRIYPVGQWTLSIFVAYSFPKYFSICIYKLSTCIALLIYYAQCKHNLNMNEIRSSYKYFCPKRLSCTSSGLQHPTLATPVVSFGNFDSLQRNRIIKGALKKRKILYLTHCLLMSYPSTKCHFTSEALRQGS